MEFILIFTIVSSCLYLYYFAFLRKENKHQFNRAFLLLLLPFSACIPFFEFNFTQTEEILPVLGSTLETITITSGEVNDWAWTHSEIISALYLSISFCLLVLLAIRLSGIFTYIKAALHRENIKGATIIYANGPIDISSFGPYIFWNANQELSETEKTQIISHELCHVKQYHSLDILFLEIWKVVFWFHPIVYMIARELKGVHEYQADQAALAESNPDSYIQLLLSKTFGQSLQLSHNFFAPSPKHRIMMILRKSNTRRAQIKYFCLLPFLLLIITACTVNVTNVDLHLVESLDEVKFLPKNEPAPAPSAEVRPDLGQNHSPADAPKALRPSADTQERVVAIDPIPSNKSVDEFFANEQEEKRMSEDFVNSPNVEFPIQEPDIEEYIAVSDFPKPINIDDIKKLVGYPEQARDNGIQGKVVLRILVDKNGHYLKHKVVSNPDLVLTEAVEKHIEKVRFQPAMKDGKPVKYWVNIPFHFKLLA